MKKILALLLILLLVVAPLAACNNGGGGGGAAANDPWDGGTIRIICPFGVGGTADAIARRFGAVAGDLFPQFTFIVDNMTGGDGFLGASYFSELPVTTTDLLIFGYGVSYRHDLGRAYGTEVVDFDRHNIQPVGVIDDRTWIVYANIGTTLEDILELGRTGRVRMSGGNPLSDPHLAFGSLLAGEGGDVIVIPFDGGALQRQALINNEVDVFIGTTQAGMEEVEAGLIVPILAINDRAFAGFVTPAGPIVVPAVAGPDRHPALSADHYGSILPAGGFIAVRRGADQAWIDMWIEIIQAVWAEPDFYEWMEEIMLNNFQLYGAAAEAHLEVAVARAMEAFRSLGG